MSMYKRFNEINPDLFRSLILGESKDTATPQQNNTGLMSPELPVLQREPSSTLTEEPSRETATPVLEESILSTVAKSMAQNTDDPKKLADAVVPEKKTQEADLSEWESMGTVDETLQGDTTRAALGSAFRQGPDSPFYQSTVPEDSRVYESEKTNTERETFTNSFYTNIGVRAETDHGSTPQVSNDAADVASGNTTYDIGYGHKITSSEFASGEIHGIQFIDDNGDYIPLTQEQKEQIMAADFEMHQQAARDAGWDQELEDRDYSWEKLDTGYQNALTSLAYNVGGTKAGQQWSNIFDYAVVGSRATNDEEERAAIRGFASHLRRKDAGRNTAGMDNRVAKELYFAGLIDSLDDVSSVLPLADADQAGIPQSAEYGSNPNRRPSGSQD